MVGGPGMLMIMGQHVLSRVFVYTLTGIFFFYYNSPYITLICRHFVWKDAEAKSIW